MKSGIKTTEFWGLAVVIAPALITMINDLVQMGSISKEATWVGVAAAGLAALYTVARTMLKREEIKGAAKCLLLGGLLFLLVGCASNTVTQAVEANELRHTNTVEAIKGMKTLVEGSPGAFEVKQEMLRKLNLALTTENALYFAMAAFLKAEEKAVDMLTELIDKLKKGVGLDGPTK